MDFDSIKRPSSDALYYAFVPYADQMERRLDLARARIKELEQERDEENAKLPRECMYCGGSPDHKHGQGHACGDCCGAHGGMSENKEDYDFVTRLLKCSFARLRRAEYAEQKIATREESKCPVCHYERSKHGDGLGLSEKEANSYIPCEYCSLKERIATVLKLAEKGLPPAVNHALIETMEMVEERWKRGHSNVEQHEVRPLIKGLRQFLSRMAEIREAVK